MVGGEVFGEGRGDRCDPGGEAYLADGGGQRQRSTLATGRSGGRSARNEPDFVRRAREVTGTLTVTEPKRRAVACSAQVCARPGTTPRNHGPAPPSRRTPESRWTQAHTCKLSHCGAWSFAAPQAQRFARIDLNEHLLERIFLTDAVESTTRLLSRGLSHEEKSFQP